jgi:hypothetical protein
MSNPYTHTTNGRFYRKSPVWDLGAIAHSLGQLSRFTGNASSLWSVAEHSLLVSLLVEYELGGTLEEAREGNLHDATESILNDIASPWKATTELKGYKVLEKELDLSMRATFDLPDAMSDVVKTADWLALFIEAYHFIPERGEDFDDPDGLRPKALRLISHGYGLRAMEDWRLSRDAWLTRMDYLSKAIGKRDMVKRTRRAPITRHG